MRKRPRLTSAVLCWELSKVLLLRGVPAKRTPLHSLASPASFCFLHTFSAYPLSTLFPFQEETMVFAPGNVFTFSFSLCLRSLQVGLILLSLRSSGGAIPSIHSLAYTSFLPNAANVSSYPVPSGLAGRNPAEEQLTGTIVDSIGIVFLAKERHSPHFNSSD